MPPTGTLQSHTSQNLSEGGDVAGGGAADGGGPRWATGGGGGTVIGGAGAAVIGGGGTVIVTAGGAGTSEEPRRGRGRGVRGVGVRGDGRGARGDVARLFGRRRLLGVWPRAFRCTTHQSIAPGLPVFSSRRRRRRRRAERVSSRASPSERGTPPTPPPCPWRAPRVLFARTSSSALPPSSPPRRFFPRAAATATVSPRVLERSWTSRRNFSVSPNLTRPSIWKPGGRDRASSRAHPRRRSRANATRRGP